MRILNRTEDIKFLSSQNGLVPSKQIHLFERLHLNKNGAIYSRAVAVALFTPFITYCLLKCMYMSVCMCMYMSSRWCGTIYTCICSTYVYVKSQRTQFHPNARHSF